MRSRRDGYRCILIAAAALAGAAMVVGPGIASAQPTRPRAAERVVKLFDFEETQNPLPVPEGWTRAQSVPTAGVERQGFPVWNGASFDKTSPAWSGQASVKLPVKGGSASLLLSPGVIPIFPSADYRVTAQVRTSPAMRHARALIAARLLDERGELLDRTEVRSDPVATGGAWRTVAVDMYGEHPEAAFMQLELLVLQPEKLRTGMRRAYEIDPQDYDAAAWFDDVTILQRPRIEVVTTTPGNVIAAPDRPVIETRVRDLAGQALSVRIEVLDHTGRRVESRTFPSVSGRLDERWTPDLPAYGWFRARTIASADGSIVGESWCDFLWLAPGDASSPDPASPDRLRFGVRVGDVPDRSRPAVPGAVARVGAGGATLPVWSARDGAHALEDIAPAVESLLSGGVDVTLTLERVPLDLAVRTGVGQNEVARLLATDRAEWGGAIDPVFDRFGQRVRRWQLGSLEDEWAGSSPAPGALFDNAAEALGVLVPAPIVSVPWAFDREIAPGVAMPDRLAAVRIGRDAGEEAISQLARAWLAAAAPSPDPRDAPELAVVLDPDPAPGVGHAEEVGAMARQAVAFWNELGAHDERVATPGADPARPVRTMLELATPWVVSTGPRPAMMPTPALGVWHTLIERLGDRVVGEQLDIAPGVRAYLLVPRPGVSSRRGGALVVWRDASRDPADSFELDLGQGRVERVDLFGNRREIRRRQPNEQIPASHRVDVGDAPAFIEGIDAELVAFQTGVRLEPGLVVSSSETHEHDLVMRNPWDHPVRARLFVVEPGGHSSPATPVDRTWEFLPRVADVTIPANGSTRVPMSIAFSPAALSGRQDLYVDADFGGHNNVVRVRGSFELRAPEVTMEVYHRIQPPQDPNARGDDVIVFAEVTNNSEETISVDLVAVAPGISRGRASISALEPGQSAVRPVPFFGLAGDLLGREVRVGLTMPDSESRLNVATVIGEE